jgi:hypothetical protein
VKLLLYQQLHTSLHQYYNQLVVWKSTIIDTLQIQSVTIVGEDVTVYVGVGVVVSLYP